MINLMPPCDLDLEQSILAGCILYENIADEIIGLISPDDFYRTSHHKIFKSIQKLANKNQKIDLPSVASSLRESKELEEIGGVVFLSQLVDSAPVPSNVSIFCEKIKNFSRLRKIINICSETSNACFDMSLESIEVINRFQTDALNLDSLIKSTFTTKEELTSQSIDRYQKARTGKTKQAISTGYGLFDKFLGGGLSGPKLVIIAARPGVGKTALMCNLIRNMCNRNTFCGCFELEMEKEALDDRWIAEAADINSMRLTQPPGPNQEEWKRIMSKAGEQSMWKLLIDDQGGIDIHELKRRARKMKKAGAQVIFIDQLSKISGNRKMSVFERNTEHVEEIGFLKKELGIPIVLLAQLNRDLEKRNDKKPVLSDLKNTGQLEEEADIVFLGYRKFVHTKDTNDETHAEWEIAKNRQGATRNIEMRFNPQRMRFDEIDFYHETEPNNANWQGRHPHKNQDFD